MSVSHVVRLLSALLLGAALVGCSDKFGFEPEDTGGGGSGGNGLADVDTSFKYDTDCNPIGWEWSCLLPYPSDHFLVDDPSTPSGKRVELPNKATPQFSETEFFNPQTIHPVDGWSPLPVILAVFPSGVDPASLTRHDGDTDKSLTADNTTILLEADSGQPVRHWAELDPAPADDKRRALIIRPFDRLKDGQRYIVAIKSLARPGGLPVLTPERFERIKNDNTGGNETLDAERERYETDIFPQLEAFGVARGDLNLAWDFTTATRDDLTADLRAIREDLVQRLPTHDFDLKVQSSDDAVGAHLARVIKGTFVVPLYLQAFTPGAYLQRDESGRVVANGTATVPFIAVIPNSVADKAADQPQANAAIFGVRVLRSMTELSEGVGAEVADGLGMVMVSTDWYGMTDDDSTEILKDINQEPDVALRFVDRVQQGIAHQVALAALIKGPLAAHETMQIDGAPAYDASWVGWYGHGGGHLFGGTVGALSPDLDRLVLGPGSAAFSHLATRSPAFSTFLGVLRGKVASGPQPDLDLQIMLALTQSTFDRIDSVTWAPHVRAEKLPQSPDRQVLMLVGIDESETPNLMSHIHARALGLSQLEPTVRELVDIPTVAAPTASALVEFGGWGVEPVPADPEVPPENTVHEDLMTHPKALEQARAFLRPGGQVTAVCDGPCDPD